jgi:WD40 repeat protein
MQFIQGQGLDQVIDELGRVRRRDGKSAGDDQAASRHHEGPAVVFQTASVTSSGLRDRKLGRVAESLVSGRLGSEGLRTSTGAAFATTQADRSNPFDPDATTGSEKRGQGRPLPEPPPAAGLSNSAVLPGGTAISSVESSGRRQPFYRSVAQIGRQVAQGLAYAHSRGVVHRDIKPSNLLLDTAGVLWITDFGLAKADDDGLTATGDILGTLRYMAPERFRGEADARADIYALGLTLYELVTLKSAYESKDRLSLIERVKNEEPVRPRSLDARIPRDLETIVLKAIEKDPARRYATALAMGDDLRRFLEDEPIQARRASAAERYARWSRHHPVIAVLGAVVTAVLVLSTTASTIVASRFASLAQRERDAKNRAAEETRQAVIARKAAETSFAEARKAEKEATEQRNRADNEAEVARQNLYYAQMHLAQQAWREHRGLRHMGELLANWVPHGMSPDRRGWEWFYLNSLPHQNVRTFTELGRADRPTTVAWHVASNRLAEGSRDGLIRIWDADREETTLTLKGPAPFIHYWGGRWFEWSPDGSKLAAGCQDATVHVWDTRSGREHNVLRGHESPVVSVAFSSDGRRIAAWELNGKIKIWDASAGELTAQLAHPGNVGAARWSPDDKLLATGHADGSVTISGAHSGDKSMTLRGHAGVITSLAWSPDSTRLASTSTDSTVRVWEVASRKMVLGPLRHSHEIMSVAWEPDGQRLATGSVDETIKIWNATTGREALTFRGHLQTVTSVAWGPDGRLASGCNDESVKVWNSMRDQESSVLPGRGVRVTSVSWSPDGKWLASGADDGKIRIWDPATRAEVKILKGHDPGRINSQFGLIRSVAWSPDGTQLASAGLDGKAAVWEAKSGREVFALPDEHGPVWSVAWSPAGADLAAASQDGTICVVEGLNRTPKAKVLKADRGRIRGLAWSPQGDYLAFGGSDGRVKVWDPVRGVELAGMPGHQGRVLAVAWSPDGKRLVSAGDDSVVIAWDAASGQRIATMRGHNDWVDAVVWSPDGKRLASAGIDNSIRIWDPRTGEETFVLRGNAGMFHDVSWHPDGAQLAAASSDGQIWIWDATRGFERDTTARALPYIDRQVASGGFPSNPFATGR